MSTLSQKALQIIQEVFGEKSSVNIPIALLNEGLEIRTWAKEELTKFEPTTNPENNEKTQTN